MKLKIVDEEAEKQKRKVDWRKVNNKNSKNTKKIRSMI
jgi:hypothetical protein